MPSLVICVCRECGKRFQRHGDSMVISARSKVVPPKAQSDPSRCRTLPQWIACMGEVCDDCLPQIPTAVLDDYFREERERSEDGRLEDRSTSTNGGRDERRRTPR